jgi:hypothetical protein
MNRVSAFGAPSIDRLQVLVLSRSIPASKSVSTLARTRPPSAYLQTRSITASKCISNLARSRPPIEFPNSYDYGLQARKIMASKCISKLAQLRPPSAYLQPRLITASKCISKPAGLRPPSVSPHSVDYGLQVHISKLA